MKFILDRTADSALHSRKWIVGHGLLFWLVSRIIASLILAACVAVYEHFGIEPDKLTRFGGSPETARNLGPLLYVLATLILAAPLFEECIFRLWLSFRRVHLAVAVAAIPLYLLWQKLLSGSALTLCIYAAGAVLLFCLVWFFVPEKQWQSHRPHCFRACVWCSAIAFGLIHLIAFTHWSLMLLPYMLCVILIPFTAGCAITYYRVNLGFRWGVALHIFNNLPGVVILLAS